MASEADAWNALEEAIEAFLQSLGQPGLLMDWVIVTHTLVPRDDGGNDHTTGYTGSEMQPLYRTLGLLEYATTTVREEITGHLKETD